MDKFKMELTWHNCKTHPPKEESNNFLVITNGNEIFNMSWSQQSGYHIEQNDSYSIPLPVVVWEDWWWADMYQTVRATREFNGGANE